jgi:hypothetical protein
LRVILGIGALAAVVAVASTLAANININSGPVEFGQGVAQTTACDDSITVTPRTQFINTANSETSTTQSIQVGAVDGADFVVLPQYGSLFYPGMQFSITYENSSAAEDLVVTEVSPLLDLISESESSTETSIYAPYDFLDGYSQAYVVTVDQSIFEWFAVATANVGGSGFQFSGVDVSDIDATEGKCRGKTFTLKAYGETETATLATYSVFVDENGFTSFDGSIESSTPGTSNSGFSMEFYAPRISASSVYKITIESSEYAQTLLDGRSFNEKQLGFTDYPPGDTDSSLGTQCSNGVCSAVYIRADFDPGMGPIDFPEIRINKNPSGTADEKWLLTITYGEDDPILIPGFIKNFNGTYGIFQFTDTSGGVTPTDGDTPTEIEVQVVFTTRGNLPVNVPGPDEEMNYEGTLTWSYPSESRYTE